MKTKPKIKSDGRTVTVRVPISIRKRGGRKVVLMPDGMEHGSRGLRCRQVDNAMVKAIARGFRWREVLEAGVHSTIKEIAEAEKIAETYVGRMLRLTLLSPDIVDAVLNARQPGELTLSVLSRGFPVFWEQQRSEFKMPPSGSGERR